MMYFYLLLSLLAIDMLAAMSPGPNFVLVVRTSIQRPRQHAAAVVLGLASANLIWCGRHSTAQPPSRKINSLYSGT